MPTVIYHEPRYYALSPSSAIEHTVADGTHQPFAPTAVDARNPSPGHLLPQPVGSIDILLVHTAARSCKHTYFLDIIHSTCKGTEIIQNHAQNYLLQVP